MYGNRSNSRSWHGWLCLRGVILLILMLILSGGTVFAKKVTLKVLMATGGTSGAIYKACMKIVQDFEALHPDIEVKFEGTVGRQYDKINLSFITRDTWDVIEAHQGVILPWASQGVLRPLDTLIEAASEFKEMPPALLNLYRYKGHIWAVPYASAPQYMLYNKDLFAEAGLKPPSRDWHLEDWYNAGLKITSPERKRWGLAGLNHDIWIMVAAQMGARLFDVDTDKVVADSLEFVKSLDFSFVKLPRITQPSGPYFIDAFSQGSIATIRGTLGIYSSCVKDRGMDESSVGAVLFPRDVRQVNFNGAPGFFIPKDAKHPEEAFEFIRFFVLRRESQQLSAQALGTPVTAAAIKDFLMPTLPRDIAQTELEATLTSIPFSGIYNMEIDAYRQNELIIQAQRAIAEGRWSPEMAAKQIATMLNGILEAELKRRK